MNKPVRRPYYRKAPLNRRAFLRRVAVASGIAGGVGYFSLRSGEEGFSLRDETGSRSLDAQSIDELPDLRVAPPKAAPPTVVSRDARVGVSENLRRALDALGGLDRYVQRNDVVLVKPLVAYDRPPSLGATSQPELVHALVRMLVDECHAEVWVTDFSIEHPEDCFRKTGIRKAVESAGGRVHIPRRTSFERLLLPEAERLREVDWLTYPLKRVTKLIGVAPVKDHMLTDAAVSLQNWLGLLHQGGREFKPDTHVALADLAVLMKPTLNIIDGTRVLMENGPTGGDISYVRKDHAVMVTHDSVGADAWAYRHLLQRDGAFPQYLALAAERTPGGSIEERMQHVRVLSA